MHLILSFPICLFLCANGNRRVCFPYILNKNHKLLLLQHFLWVMEACSCVRNRTIQKTLFRRKSILNRLTPHLPPSIKHKAIQSISSCVCVLFSGGKQIWTEIHETSHVQRACLWQQANYFPPLFWQPNSFQVQSNLHFMKLAVTEEVEVENKETAHVSSKHGYWSVRVSMRSIH